MSLTGGDWEDNIRQAAKEQRMLKEAGLVSIAPAVQPGDPGKGNGAEPPGDPQKKPTQDEDQPEGGDAS
jgi:hypothetical protein